MALAMPQNHLKRQLKIYPIPFVEAADASFGALISPVQREYQKQILHILEVNIA